MDKHAKARRALRKSINHWMLDIVVPLKAGYIIDPITMRWTHKDEDVKCGAKYCTLCQEYSGCISEKDMDIVFQGILSSADLIDRTEYICPLYLIQNDICGPSTAWSNFIHNPCLETAEALVDKLVDCYNEYV